MSELDKLCAALQRLRAGVLGREFDWGYVEQNEPPEQGGNLVDDLRLLVTAWEERLGPIDGGD